MTPQPKWIPVKEAWRIATQNATEISLVQFTSWCKAGKHGIVAGRFGDRLVVRSDTIPGVNLIAHS